MAALVGGGQPPQPGEISLADQGILFLDELAEFPRRTLEALREPLETGHVVVSRAARQARFPARVLLVAAMNPCPCGWLGNRLPGAPACRCTPDAVQRYQGRLSGPLLDRLDLQLEVPAGAPADLLRPPDGEDSLTVAKRVAQARTLQLQRQGCRNGELGSAALVEHAPLKGASQAFLQRAAERLGLSGRGLHRPGAGARSRGAAPGRGPSDAAWSHAARAHLAAGSIDQGCQRTARLVQAQALSAGPVLELVCTDLADIEVARFGV
jgi:magnesium chelatase family protein